MVLYHAGMTTSLIVSADHDACEVADAIRACHRRSNAVRAELLDEIARFDALELHDCFGAASTAEWLQRELKYRRATAFEYVGVARKLQRFGLLFSVFRDGDIDYTTVRFLLRYITEDNEAELVDLATRLCFAELEQALAGNEPADEDSDAPFFNAWVRDDGMLVGEFLLPPVEGVKLQAVLKIAQLISEGVDPADIDLDALVTEEEEKEERKVQLDDAPVTDEACPAEQTAEAKGLSMEAVCRLPSRFGPPVKADLYPAFIHLIEMVRANPHAAARAPGADVTIMLTEDGKAWMPQNPQAPSRVLANFVANATLRCNLVDSRGVTMHYGRRRRNASDAQIRALLEVWGHQCAMPGCTHSRFIEIHHLHEWADGGATDIGNLIPLCSSCHSKVSVGVARITQRGPDLEFLFMDGSRFISRNRGLPEEAPKLDAPEDESSFR